MRHRSPKAFLMMIDPHSLQIRALDTGRGLVCYERKGADLSAPLPVTRNPHPGLTLAMPRNCAALPVDGLDSPSDAPTVLSATDSLSGACSHRARRISRHHGPSSQHLALPVMRQGGDAVNGLKDAQRRVSGNGAVSDTDHR